MNHDVIQARNLTKIYSNPVNGLPAVHDLSFDIQPGEIVALLGRNGAGKSTTIRMLLGHELPSWGHSSLFGESSMKLSPGVMGKIGYMAEDHPLLEWMTLRRLVAFTQETFSTWDQNRFQELAAQLRLNSGSKIKSLSRGQRAQVALAITLACQPELLILDDPTLGLDVAVHRDFLRECINLVSDEGKTVLLSTHNLLDVGRMADRLLILQDGVLRADISTEGFSSAFTELHFRCSGPICAPPEHPGILQAKRVQSNLSIVVSTEFSQDMHHWAENNQASFLEETPLDLEELFILFTELKPVSISVDGE